MPWPWHPEHFFNGLLDSRPPVCPRRHPPRHRLLLPGALLLGLVASAAAPPRDCARCAGEGVVPCGRHPRTDAPCELTARYCSEIADCDTCGGTAWLDCPKCDAPDAEAYLAGERERAERAARELAWIGEGMGRAVRTLTSEHFVVVWEIERMRAGRKRRDGHELGHLYLDRLEALFDAYVGVLEADPHDFPEKLTVLVWEEKQDQLRSSARFCGSESEAAIKQMGAVARLSLCGQKPYYEDEAALHRAVVHDVVHLLGSTQRPPAWIGELRAGWADAGFAHWVEDRLFGTCDNVCFHAHYFRDDLDPEGWRDHVLKLVARDKVPDLPALLARNTETLTLEDHAVAFSLVDFLMAKGGGRFNAFLARLRTRTHARDALFEIYQLSLDGLEEQWRSWVEATY
jgi:hypothetical protein